MKAIWGTLMALAMAAACVAPATAQSSFGFEFGFGNRGFDPYPQRAICLTDRQIRQSIAARGFSQIALNVPNERRIQVRAVREGWVYLIDFDFCADRIRGVTQLRPAR